MKKLAVLAAMTLALSAGSMFGGQITQTATLPSTLTDVSPTFTFQDFASAPGYISGEILTSVTLELSITEVLSALTITNSDPVSHTFDYSSTSKITVLGTAPIADLNDIKNDFLLSSTGNPITLYDTGPNYTLAANSSAQLVSAGNTVTLVLDSGVQNAVSISPYNTSGTFTFDFSTLTGTTFSGGGGNLGAAQTTNASAVATVIYNYTIPTGTPEPATMTLFGSALLGIGFFARKRIKKN
jgi:hypothetical protein